MNSSTVVLLSCIILVLSLLHQAADAKSWLVKKEKQERENKWEKPCDRWELSYGAVDCVNNVKLDSGPSHLKGECRVLASIKMCYENLFEGCTDKDLEVLRLLRHWKHFQNEVGRACGI